MSINYKDLENCKCLIDEIINYYNKDNNVELIYLTKTIEINKKMEPTIYLFIVVNSKYQDKDHYSYEGRVNELNSNSNIKLKIKKDYYENYNNKRHFFNNKDYMRYWYFINGRIIYQKERKYINFQDELKKDYDESMNFIVDNKNKTYKLVLEPKRY